MPRLTLKERLQCTWANKPVLAASVAVTGAAIGGALNVAGVADLSNGDLATAAIAGAAALWITRGGAGTEYAYRVMKKHIAHMGGVARPEFAARLLTHTYCTNKGADLAIRNAGGYQKVLPHAVVIDFRTPYARD